MAHEIIDMIVQAKVEGRKPRFNALMIKYIVETLTND